MPTIKNSSTLTNFVGHSLLIFCVALVAIGLTYHYWYGENGRNALTSLTKELREQQEQNALQHQKNDRLKADVADLKTGLVATEEHARTTLGLIKPNEIFVQVSTVPISKSDIPVTNYEPDAIEALDAMVEENDNQ